MTHPGNNFGSKISVPESVNAFAKAAEGYSDGVTVSLRISNVAGVEDAERVYDAFWNSVSPKSSLLRVDGDTFVRVPHAAFIAKFGPFAIS